MFIPNPLFDVQQKLDPEYLDGLMEHAKGLADTVKSKAPVATGDYVRSIRALRTLTSVTVGTNDFAGHIVEWGSINSPAYAPIRRGVLAAGLRLEEK